MLLYNSDSLIRDSKIQPNYKLLLLYLDYLYSQRIRVLTKDDIAKDLGYSKNHVNKLLRFFAKSYDEQAEYIRNKYLTIVFKRNNIDKKNGTYLPDSISISFKHEDLEILNKALPFQPGESVFQYFKKSKYFSSENPTNIINIVQPKTEEGFLKALIYVDTRKGVKNHVGYLKTCFDQEGNYLYGGKEKAFKAPVRKTQPTIKTVPTIDSNYFYLLKPEEFKKLKENNIEGYRVFAQVYKKFVLIYSLTYHSKKANIENYLIKLKVTYEQRKY